MTITVDRLPLTQSNRPLEFFLGYADELVMDQDYQRGLVWGTDRQVNLWYSLLAGIPIPSLILNDRLGADFDGPGSYAVVDGKQRVHAVLGFLRDGFALPGDWFGAAAPQHFSELDVVTRRRLCQRTLAVSEGRLPTIADERRVFDLVNFGGVPQGDSDVIPA